MLYSDIPVQQNFCKATLDRNARAIRDALAKLSKTEKPGDSALAERILEQHWFLDLQLDELQETFTSTFARKLARSEPSIRATVPRVYRSLSRTLGCLVSSNFGSHLFGKYLSTSALSELLVPDQLGESLTLQELRALPAVAKLIVLERLAELLASFSKDLSQKPSVHVDQERELQGVIRSLQSLTRVRWPALLESISPVHRILELDPSGTYKRMDLESRGMYRRAVEQLALDTGESEERVAQLALQLARLSPEVGDDKRRHVGYYLLDDGVSELKKRGHLRVSGMGALRDFILRHALSCQIGSSAVFTLIGALLIDRTVGSVSNLWLAVFILAASSPAIALTNLILSQLLLPRYMPRLDFSKGIPDQSCTMVVVPTLLLSRSAVEKLIAQLEIHSLANRDPNLHFALLTDFPDSNSKEPADPALLKACARGVERLNRRYLNSGGARFFLFHRGSEWNPAQSKWMGRERKRGKLEDFNLLLLGREDRFQVKVGDLSVLSTIKYVITLDTDTELSPEAAWKLVGTLSHPLHKAAVDPSSRTVKSGYTILQPHVSTSVESNAKSYFSNIYADAAGLDPYGNSRSEVYQDLYGRANYFGKGIYDVAVFDKVLSERFPDNTLLSHDLIEGEYARVGLVTDADVVEDFPSTYEAHSKRKHRWVRGDWQIVNWLLPRVPTRTGIYERNPLGVLSRWKFADNLRRSLFEIALFAITVSAVLLGPARGVNALICAFGILLFPSYARFIFSLFRLPSRPYQRAYLRSRFSELWRSHVQSFFDFVFLPHQAFLMLDAILRTLARKWITHRNFLEWETMAQAETARGGLFSGSQYAISVALGAILLVDILGGKSVVPFHVIGWLWVSAPLVSRLLRATPWHSRPRAASKEIRFLRDVALRTWRYFIDFSRPEEHWLVPDNIQEEPYSVTHKTSPTNLGLQLASNMAALDFGYITRTELAIRLNDLFRTVEAMEKHRGHLLNWYDTETLQPLSPRYVSTVDSGNLAAALIAVRQGCLRLGDSSLISRNALEGLHDHCIQLQRALPLSMKLPATYRLLHAVIRQLEHEPKSLPDWDDTLARIRALLMELIPRIETLTQHIESHDAARAEELRYWLRAVHVRLTAIRANLHDFAPWLRSEHCTTLRAWAMNSGFDDLLAELSRIPRFGELAEVYERIDGCIAALLDNTFESHPSQRQDLEMNTRAKLMVLRDEINLAQQKHVNLLSRFVSHAQHAESLTLSMDFGFLFDPEREMMRIGYNVEKQSLDESFYDLLASEARTALFLAVAKGDVPLKSWFQLGRKITSFRGHETLMSWSGTMFEYLMPSLFMRTYSTTLLDESLRGAVRVQQAYARELDIPWGISESSCSWRNDDMQYFYHAFGIPQISLRGEEAGRVVIAPYASMLALMLDQRTAAENLRSMASRGWMGRYGFFEAAEFGEEEDSRQKRKPATVVRSFMAHHQGMGFLALCNALLGNKMQERFHAEPMVAATELLLQERMPSVFASGGR